MTSTSIPSDFSMSFRISLPQELVNEVIDNLSDDVDLEACSLVSGSWAYPARSRLFHHVRLCSAEAEDWLSRPTESVQRMAPHIVKFELSDYWTRPLTAPAFHWGGSDSLLPRLITSLTSSPVQSLRIESFYTGGFNKSTLEQCFLPICHSLRSLELNDLTACPDASTYLLSLFPNLDDIHIGEVVPISTQPEWDGCGIKHSPRLSGVLRFSGLTATDNSGLFAGITSLSPRFHAISPGRITDQNWNSVRELMESCSETVESVPLVWWSSTGVCVAICTGNF